MRWIDAARIHPTALNTNRPTRAHSTVPTPPSQSQTSHAVSARREDGGEAEQVFVHDDGAGLAWATGGTPPMA